MYEALIPIIEKVWSYCAKTEIRGRTVTLNVKYEDFQQITRSRSLQEEIKNREDIDRLVKDLLMGLFPMSKAVRLLGVTLSGLNTETNEVEMDNGCQLSLGF